MTVLSFGSSQENTVILFSGLLLVRYDPAVGANTTWSLFHRVVRSHSGERTSMRKPDTRDKRTLARALKKRRATPFQTTAAAILLNTVGLPAALRFLKGPRRRFLRSAGDVRRYLTGHGITDSVSIKRLGLCHKPLFVVCYADIDSVQAVRFAVCNGRARLRLSHSPSPWPWHPKPLPPRRKRQPRRRHRSLLQNLLPGRQRPFLPLSPRPSRWPSPRLTPPCG